MFGKGAENSAREAEAARLCALSVEALAAEIVPVFGPVPTTTYGGVLFVTRLGEKAPADGTVRRYLNARGPV